MDELPVNDCLPDVVAAMRSHQPVILRAPPGAGKTTAVPPAVLESGALTSGNILLLQPRRMRRAPRRIASPVRSAKRSDRRTVITFASTAGFHPAPR